MRTRASQTWTTYSRGTAVMVVVAMLAMAGVALPWAGARSVTKIVVNDSEISGNPRFDYDHDWETVRGSTRFESDEHKSDRVGASFTFRFEGIEASLYGRVGRSGGLAAISVDGVQVGQVDRYAPQHMTGMLIWQSPELEEGPHEIVVTSVGVSPIGKEGSVVWIDRAVVVALADASTTEPSATSAPTAEPTDSSTPKPTVSESPTPTPGPTGSGGGDPTAGNYIIVGAQELAGLPTSGAAWTALNNAGSASLGQPDLADQNSTVAGRTVAAALVYARTGDQTYRDRVVAVLNGAEQASLANARVLSVGRQLAGFVIAADLVGYRADSFVAWASSLRTKTIGGHSRWYALSQTSEDSANNWGSWALASRIAISAYLGDQSDLDRAALVFRGMMGERDAYAGFKPTADFDRTWACDPDRWVPINPAGCGALSGAPVEDVSRSAGSAPSIDATGRMYAWEFLGGATLSARVLAHSGYPSVYSWGDQAILRAGRFLAANGGYPAPYSVNQYIPWEIDKAYGVKLGSINAAGYGRQFGFTDWLS